MNLKQILKQRYQGKGNEKRGVVIILTRDKRHSRKRKCYRDKEVHYARKRNKRHPYWKRRTKTISIHIWDNLVPRKSKQIPHKDC